MLDFWSSSWTRSIVGSWTVCEGVTVPSVGMIKFSPQENWGSAEDREGKARGDPVYLESSSLKVSGKIPEEDEDEGELRFAASPKPWPPKNSASTKSRLIGKAGDQLVWYNSVGSGVDVPWGSVGNCAESIETRGGEEATETESHIGSDGSAGDGEGGKEDGHGEDDEGLPAEIVGEFEESGRASTSVIA